MNQFDVTVFHAINNLAANHQHPILDVLMQFFAQYALEMYAVLFDIAWFSLPKSDENRRHSLVVAGIAGILALLINVMTSQIWYRSRPFVVLPQGTFHQIIPHSIDASFPSDHTSGSFAFAFGSMGRAPRWVQYSFTILAVLVMFSRIYCGVHWPTDVLASVVVGFFASAIMKRLSKYVRPLTTMGLKVFHYGSYRKQLNE